MSTPGGEGGAQMSHTSSFVSTRLESRRMAESLKDDTCSPRAALSLGMSCMSLRVPFATPGSLPSTGQSPSSGATPRRRGSGLTTSGLMGASDTISSEAGSVTSAFVPKPMRGLFDTLGLTPIGPRVDMNGTDPFNGRAGSGFGTPIPTYGDALPPRPPVETPTNAMSEREHHDGELDSSSVSPRHVSFGPLGRLSRLPLPLPGGSPGAQSAANETLIDRESTIIQDGSDKQKLLGAGIDSMEDEHCLKHQRISPGSRENNHNDAAHRTATGQPPRTEDVAPTTSADGMAHTVALLVLFSKAYQLLYSYQCHDCISLLHNLPRTHFSCGFVQQLLGRAYFEMADYKPALLALKEMLTLEPFRVKGTDILSTTLWHLKREKELCALAQQLVEVDKMAPEVWCVVGNSFSLQREPDTAIKFFERALEIDPNFTYAHTLCGHELVSNEDLERAASAFRSAIKCDGRHYTAWYGLGSIYTRQERFDMAEYHFRRALLINPSSSVLRCYLGMVLHYQGSDNQSKADEALKILTDACEADMNNSQLRFQLAHVLVAAGRFEDAKTELEVLREVVPREPPVYSLLGQVCQRLGYTREAYLYYNTAIDLDHREASSLKVALASLGEDDEQDSSSAATMSQTDEIGDSGQNDSNSDEEDEEGEEEDGDDGLDAEEDEGELEDGLYEQNGEL